MNHLLPSTTPMAWLRACLVAGLVPILASSVSQAQAPDTLNTPLDPSHIAPHDAETFEAQVEGNTIGTQTVELKRTDDGFIFRETTVMPDQMQSTEVRFGTDLQMRSAHQEGLAGDNEVRIDVDYTDGHATGTARVPGPDGIREVNVDARVPLDVVDDNVFVSLLPAMPWAPGAEWTVPVFASYRNELLNYTFQVGQIDTTSTPAGEYTTYRADVTTTNQSFVFYVTAEPPHELVKLTIPGSPLEIVRSDPSTDTKPR